MGQKNEHTKEANLPMTDFSHPGINHSTLKLRHLISQCQAVLASYCSCNKVPQIYWLKPMQIYYLIVLEVRNLTRLKSGC